MDDPLANSSFTWRYSHTKPWKSCPSTPGYIREVDHERAHPVPGQVNWSRVSFNALGKVIWFLVQEHRVLVTVVVTSNAVIGNLQKENKIG